MLPKLKAFYMKAILPELAMPRYNLNPGIREPDMPWVIIYQVIHSVIQNDTYTKFTNIAYVCLSSPQCDIKNNMKGAACRAGNDYPS